MTDFSKIDLFRDKELPNDPYPFYEWVREQGPIWYYPLWGVWLVTGYDEVIAIYHDQKTWSNCNTVSGPFFKMSVPLEGDDITDIIEAHRDELPFSDQLPSFDPPKHTAHRGLAHAPDHTEAPEGERGVHVEARRRHDRRVHRPWRVRAPPGLRDPVHPDGHRRPPRRARRRPRSVPRAARAQGAPGSGSSTSRSDSSTSSSLATSRTAARTLATTS